MHYFVEDLTGLAAATLLAAGLVVLPGFALARLFIREPGSDGQAVDPAWGLLLAVSILPAADALLLRWAGMPAMLAVHLCLAAFGALAAWEAVRRIPPNWWIAVVAAWLAVAWANVDFDWNHRLNQPLTVIDTVKHAAVVASLAGHGLPLSDPFFARPGIAGYYYYFYLAPALIHWIGGALVDSRMAFAAASFVTLLAFPAMLWRMADAALLLHEPQRRARHLGFLVLLCCVSGLDLLPAAAIAKISGFTLPQLDWWSEEVRWALTSLLWVPHHMSAIIAVYTGSLLLSGARKSRRQVPVALAGFAFATAFGSSVWVALAAAAVLAVWWLWDRFEADAVPAWVLPAAAAVALVLTIPQIHDLLIGRAADGAPIGFHVRRVGPIPGHAHSLGQALTWLALMPGDYLIEFGLFSIGGIAFLRRGGFSAMRSTAIGRLLLAGVPVALLLSIFVQSTIIYNDFGWRCLWFAQVPAMLWTAAILTDSTEELRGATVWTAALALGLTATAWDLAGLRLIRAPRFQIAQAFVNSDPAVDYDLRGTYQWANRNLREGVILQHNPPIVRALDFGLYGERGVGVADVQARLFGANEREIDGRINTLSPIFTRRMDLADVRRRAAAEGIGAILLTRTDPLWRASGEPPADWTCAYRSRSSCVMLVEGGR